LYDSDLTLLKNCIALYQNIINTHRYLLEKFIPLFSGSFSVFGRSLALIRRIDLISHRFSNTVLMWRGLKVLWKDGIRHGDLKLENLLISV
jgi:hypothetical protein